MKVIIVALLVVGILAAGADTWNILGSLPACYTSIPFKVGLASGVSDYSFEARDLPAFCKIDGKTGVISGQTDSAGAWPINVKVSSKGGKSINKQYIINVLDTNNGQDNLWSSSAKSYYERPATKPLKVVASKAGSTVIAKGDRFSYNFGTQNAIGNPVYAFLNLPDGLSGDSKTGGISGAFTVPGIYTLGVEVADQSGSSAQGFVSVTVADKQADLAQVSVLNKVTVSNFVPFVYNIDLITAQLTDANKALFAALAVVNAAKAEAATRQGVFDSINVKLVASEANADKAAAAAAKANTDREGAAARLSQTNKALTNAENTLNLALLNQAGVQAKVKKAQDDVASAQDKFSAAQRVLSDADKVARDATTDLNLKRVAEAQSKTAQQNAQRDFNRANEDLNDAKNKLSAATEAQARAQDDVTKAQNDLSLAQQAYDIAAKQLQTATAALASAAAARQAALRVLQEATVANQKATTLLGSVEWNLSQAVAALNVANAAKDAADRTTALIIANGSPLGFSSASTAIDTTAVFQNCKNTDLPSYAGSVKVKDVYTDRAVLSTGNLILFGGCTQGRERLTKGATVNIKGVINPASKCIEVYSVSAAALR